MKLLQLNIFQGTFIDRVISYVNHNDFDVLHFQEVSGGKFSAKNIDCFTKLKSALPAFTSEQSISLRLSNDSTSYFSNVTFYKTSIMCVKKEVLWLKNYTEPVHPKELALKDWPRCALSLLLQINGKLIWFINTHLAWGPNPHDTDYKIIQGNKLHTYIKNLRKPFILSGDFNVSKNSRIIKNLDLVGKNLSTEHKIENTLNPRIHIARNLFPKGEAVDYIFTSKNIMTKHFSVLTDLDLSDHLGLQAELTVM